MKTENLTSKGLLLVALGIVYGDIGTSPLYMLKAALDPRYIQVTETSILGIVSLIIWTLILVASFKYLFIVLKADNRGEGGILALFALLSSKFKRFQKYFLPLAILGVALFYGDGIITPAISVLGAVEGLSVISSTYEAYIVPLSVFILLSLFMLQSRGTLKISRLFGPVMIIWFLTLIVIGFLQLIKNPSVLRAINPYYAVLFLFKAPFSSLLYGLGNVTLAVTGVEALYADLGHTTKKAIRTAWFSLVFPAIIVNTLGQAALLLRCPEAVANPFYNLVSPSYLLPLLILATTASIIASQAIISGVYSITQQAIQMGFLPRLKIRYTSDRHIGQIYVPLSNKLMCFFTILLVFIFKKSANLAEAYGVAVCFTMVLTSLFLLFVARHLWDWSFKKIALQIGTTLCLELLLFSSSLSKIPDGGWITFLIAGILFFIMSTWIKGQHLMKKAEKPITLTHFFESMPDYQQTPGTGIHCCSDPNFAPQSLIYTLKYYNVLHEVTCLLHFNTLPVPWIRQQENHSIEMLFQDFYLIRVDYGFMQVPSIPKILKFLTKEEEFKDIFSKTAVFFMTRKVAKAPKRRGIKGLRENFFVFLSQNAQSATDFFRLPPEKTLEYRIRISIKDF